jgi:hypothetical protein
MSLSPSLVAWMAVENALHKIGSICAEKRSLLRMLVAVYWTFSQYVFTQSINKFCKNAVSSDDRESIIMSISLPYLGLRRFREPILPSLKSLAKDKD